MTIDRYATEPLQDQLLALLRQRLAAGEWQPGGWLPSEPALAREYGISRGTVRAALRVPIDEGLLISRYGRGPWCAGPETSHRLLAET